MPFLGDEAPFPLGAFRLAALLRRRVLLMQGIYLGGNRYRVRFAPIADFSSIAAGGRDAAVQDAVRRYAAELEQACRAHPYNWFNFFDFWKADDDADSLGRWPRAAAAGVAWPAAAQWSVNDLMTALAARGSADATFTEQRYVPILDAPVQSSGTLRFVAPDRLEKHTLQPRAESLVLAGNQLTLRQGQRTRSLALTDLPDNGLAIASLRGTMAGDLAALRRGWNVTLHGERRIWTLSLTPVSAVGRAVHRGAC